VFSLYTLEVVEKMVDEKGFEPSACPIRSDRSYAPQEEEASGRTFGGREGIRTPGLLVANGESLKLRRVATIS